MTEKNRCIFHVITWTSVATLILIAGGVGFHFYSKGRTRSSSLLLGSSNSSSSATDGNHTSQQGFPKDHLPYLTSSSRNDSLNELPLGPIVGTGGKSFNNNINNRLNSNNNTLAIAGGGIVKRIAMEGSVNEVPNFYKRYGKFPNHQNRGTFDKPNGLHSQQFTQKPVLSQQYNSSIKSGISGTTSTTTTIASHTEDLLTSVYHDDEDDEDNEYDDDNDSKLAESQLENEIIKSARIFNSSNYQSERLSMIY